MPRAIRLPWPEPGSNRRPQHFQCCALPTELSGLSGGDSVASCGGRGQSRRVALPRRGGGGGTGHGLRATGIEPALPRGNENLNLARLPVPPRPRRAASLRHATAQPDPGRPGRVAVLARDRSRTCTPLREPPPEDGASANSATRAASTRTIAAAGPDASPRPRGQGNREVGGEASAGSARGRPLARGCALRASPIRGVAPLQHKADKERKAGKAAAWWTEAVPPASCLSRLCLLLWSLASS